MISPSFLWLSVLIAAATSIGGLTTEAKNYETIQGRACFRSMKGMMDSMFYLSEDHPGLMTITKIGESYLKQNKGQKFGKYDIPTGGYDIYAIKVTASDNDSNVKSKDKKGKILITSGVHAREWAPPELLARFIEMLVHGYNTHDAEITTILQRTEVHAILYVNPDGRYMAEKYPELYWRKNMNPNNNGCSSSSSSSSSSDGGYGTDINRNFDFMWGDQLGASDSPCDSDYHGKSPESEPETQALANYAKRLFPESQRKNNPEKQMNEPFGEENTGMYIDIHSSGGYVYYPWGHKDAKSPDDEALQALGRKINSFNGYKLWAGSQPDFVYEASGDTSDYMYAVTGVASLGFEIGDDFYQDCNTFEKDVVPINLPALLYATKLANKPFKQVKGPDVLKLDARYTNSGQIKVSAHVSDSEMVNAIRGFPNFQTGKQTIANVQVYLDVHPDDFKSGRDISWSMQPSRRRLEDAAVDITNRARAVNCSKFTKKKKCKRNSGGACEWLTQTKTCKAKGSGSAGGSSGSNTIVDEPSTQDGNAENQFNSGDEDVSLTIDSTSIPAGKHMLYVQATDSDDYKGPVSSVYIDVSKRQREASLRGTRTP